ncbi:hypothetical protein GBL_1100 [Geobacillus kaustophilus GBlys]|uniref:Uncharacterized protein n=1 Tax=Geobacillus kaustophilus GBlys TaxID=1337888 RepID=U2Y897_GEOKU|nr:hypothetical protein GBL_1100 [Geobacillus kaustophilus GBlys]GAJ57141.1 hypothetical protein B23_0330 [Geobacillus thermoleovorans B23]
MQPERSYSLFPTTIRCLSLENPEWAANWMATSRHNDSLSVFGKR